MCKFDYQLDLIVNVLKHGGRLLGLFLPFLPKLRVLGHKKKKKKPRLFHTLKQLRLFWIGESLIMNHSISHGKQEICMPLLLWT